MKVRVTADLFMPEDADLVRLERRTREFFFGLDSTDIVRDVDVEAL